MEFIIDKIAVQTKNATGSVDWELRSVDEFTKIPLRERLTMLRASQIQFLDKSGNQIPSVEALKIIKAMS